MQYENWKQVFLFSFSKLKLLPNEKETYFRSQIKTGPCLKFHILGPVLYLVTVCIPDFTTQLQNYHTKLKTCQLRSDKVIEMTGFEFTVN